MKLTTSELCDQRFVLSIKSECLSKLVPLGEGQPGRRVTGVVWYRRRRSR